MTCADAADLLRAADDLGVILLASDGATVRPITGTDFDVAATTFSFRVDEAGEPITARDAISRLTINPDLADFEVLTPAGPLTNAQYADAGLELRVDPITVEEEEETEG